MRKNAKNTLLVFILLAFLLVACGGDAIPPTNTPEPVSVADPDSEPSGDSVADPGPESIDLSDEDAFQEIPGDYTLMMEFSFEGQSADGTSLIGDLTLDGKQKSNAEASSMAIRASGAANLGGVNYVEFVELDGRLYFFNELNGCVNLPDDEEPDSLFNNLVDTGGFLTGHVQRALPNEVINGVPSYHFSITQDNLDSSDPDAMDVSEITNGGLYVAIDGGYVVRLLIEGTGTSELLSGGLDVVGDIFYQLDFIPSEENLLIVPPAGCEEGAAPETEFPVLENASNPSSFAGIYSYQSVVTIEEALNFYKGNLAADGWALGQEISAGNTAVLQFTKGGRNLSVAITEDPNNAGTMNILIAEEQ